jgi:hypothetical protein
MQFAFLIDNIEVQLSQVRQGPKLEDSSFLPAKGTDTDMVLSSHRSHYQFFHCQASSGEVPGRNIVEKASVPSKMIF